MIDPASGPFVFDTSADSFLNRAVSPADDLWLDRYFARFPMLVSAVTVVERLRGFALLRQQMEPAARARAEAERQHYLRAIEAGRIQVLPLTTEAAKFGAELMALCPFPPSPPRRTHRRAESRSERLARWRFDILIAATALAEGLPLIHNNPDDFEALRAAIERAPERFPEAGPLDLISVRRLSMLQSGTEA